MNRFVNVFGTLGAAGERPVLGGVQCEGSESDLISCPRTSGITLPLICSGRDNAGVDCAGRRERENTYRCVMSVCSKAWCSQ